MMLMMKMTDVGGVSVTARDQLCARLKLLSDDIMSYHEEVGGDFSEGAARPPVPGEEGGLYCDWSEAPVAPCVSGLDVGSAHEAEMLLTLLDDHDGTALFLCFLQTLGCAALLDFWFACSGFQKVPQDTVERRLKLAKAMYRSYLCDGVVSRKITAEARRDIRNGIRRLQLDHDLFAQAHAQVQAVLQDTLFPLFLRSDVYSEWSPGKHKTLISGLQEEEPVKELRPPPSAAGQQECRRDAAGHSRTRPAPSCPVTAESSLNRQQRHRRIPETHPKHTPVRMTTHTFAAELTRRLQELQLQIPTQTHTEEEADSSGHTVTCPCSCDVSSSKRCVTVVFWYEGELVPYRTCVQSDPAVTLGLFRRLVTRRGPFRFFFKRPSGEFECGAVFEEICRDEAVLPVLEQKITARVERLTHTWTPALLSPHHHGY